VIFVTVERPGPFYFCGMENFFRPKGDKMVIWFSRILRWALGIGLLFLGAKYLKEDYGWVLILFGSITVVTGFLRPKRCLDDNCNV